jgi:hypothetical protein
MTQKKSPRNIGPVAAAAIVAIALISAIAVSSPASDDSDGADDVYTVTLLKYGLFQLMDGPGEDSDPVPGGENGIYRFEDGPVTVYIAYRSGMHGGSLIGTVIDDGPFRQNVLSVTVDRDMTVLPVEKLEGYTIATEGEFGAKEYVTVADDGNGIYTASIEFADGGGTVDVAAQVVGVTIHGDWDGDTLNLRIEDHVGYRGTVPATMTIHDGNEVQWYKVYIFIAGPLVDANRRP